VVDGKLLSVVDGDEFDHGDMASATKVKSLFDASDKQIAEQTASVQRRADSNLGDLVKKLVTGYEENTKATNGIIVALGQIHDVVNATAVVGSVTIQQNDQATGLPWNPIPSIRLASALSDLGGDKVRVTFPPGRELIAEDSIQIYQCKFTYVDAKGKVDAKKFRFSTAVAAKHARSFECVVPPWGQGGSLPPLSKWSTTFAVYENLREMPAPKGGATFNWLPNTPSINVGPQTTIQLVGPKTGKTFQHSLSIDYPYGSEGFKDVQIKATSSNTKELTDIKIATTDTGSAARVMSFVIKKSDTAKTATYKITLQATSSKTGLKSSSVLTIAFKVQPPALGKGGSENIFSSKALEFIHKKVGVGSAETWELCYSAKKHGWNSRTFRSRCYDKGPLFYFQKSLKTKAIFGGNWHQNAKDRGYSYDRVATNDPGPWVYRIMPSTPDKVEIAPKFNGQSGGWRGFHPDNPDYLMCFGGGHDVCCNNAGSCWTNMGHDYRPPISGHYGSTSWKSWFNGGRSYSWNAKNDGDLYEVYIVKK